jgi:hypothetical protein
MTTLKERFKTIDKFKKYFTEKLENLPLNKPIYNPDNEIIELLLYHPDYEKYNIFSLEYIIMRNDGSKYSVLLIKTEGCEEKTISREVCIRRILGLPPITNKKNINGIFRDLIYNSNKHIQFRLNNINNKKCEICFNTENLAVDHYPKSFKQINDQFLQRYNININDIEYETSKVSLHKKHFIDQTLSINWVEFHDNNVEYRYLCGSCNSRQGTNGYKKYI